MNVHPSNLLEKLNTLPTYLLLYLLPYLDEQTVQTIYSIAAADSQSHINLSEHPFLSLVSFSHFAKKYLTGADRSLYFSFYSQPAFQEYQASLLGEISQTGIQKYLNYDLGLERLYGQMRKQLEDLDSKEDIIELIKLTVTDPELPFPKMRKQGMGIHCSSSLQFGLVDLKFGKKQDNCIEECIEDLGSYLEATENKSVEMVLQTVLDDKDWKANDFFKMEKVELELKHTSSYIEGKNTQAPKNKITNNLFAPKRNLIETIETCYYHPEQISIVNYHKFLIPGVKAHNIFVISHAVISALAEIYQRYISDQFAEFQKFVEFVTRFSIYRSVIVSFVSIGLSDVVYKAIESLLDKVYEGQGLADLDQQDQLGKLQDSRNRKKSSKYYYKESDSSGMSPEFEDNQVIVELECQSPSSYLESSKKNASLNKRRTIQIEGMTKMEGQFYVSGCKIWVNTLEKNGHNVLKNQFNSSSMNSRFKGSNYNQSSSSSSSSYYKNHAANFDINDDKLSERSIRQGISLEEVNKKAYLKIVHQLFSNNIQNKVNMFLEEMENSFKSFSTGASISGIVNISGVSDPGAGNIFGPPAIDQIANDDIFGDIVEAEEIVEGNVSHHQQMQQPQMQIHNPFGGSNLNLASSLNLAMSIDYIPHSNVVDQRGNQPINNQFMRMFSNKFKIVPYRYDRFIRYSNPKTAYGQKVHKKLANHFHNLNESQKEHSPEQSVSLKKQELQKSVPHCPQSSFEQFERKYKLSVDEGHKGLSPVQQNEKSLKLLNLQRHQLSYKKLISKNSVLSKFSLKTQGAFSVSSIEELFENEAYLQEQIIQEYNSYLMDVSINQVTVHWCGHSKQELISTQRQTYNGFQNFYEDFLLYEKGLFGYFQQLIEEAFKGGSQIKNTSILPDTLPRSKSAQAKSNKFSIGAQKVRMLHFILTNHLQYLDSGIINQYLLHEIYKMAQSRLTNFINLCEKQEQNGSHESLEVQDEYKLFSLGERLEEMDKILEHYNTKVWRLPTNLTPETLLITRKFYPILQNEILEQFPESQQDLQQKTVRRRRKSEQVEIKNKF